MRLLLCAGYILEDGAQNPGMFRGQGFKEPNPPLFAFPGDLISASCPVGSHSSSTWNCSCVPGTSPRRAQQQSGRGSRGQERKLNWSLLPKCRATPAASQPRSPAAPGPRPPRGVRAREERALGCEQDEARPAGGRGGGGGGGSRRRRRCWRRRRRGTRGSSLERPPQQ